LLGNFKNVLSWLYLLRKARGVVVFVQFISANLRVVRLLFPPAWVDQPFFRIRCQIDIMGVTVCKGRVGMKRIGVFHETDAKAGGVVLRR
jgi:hypothetical protein